MNNNQLVTKKITLATVKSFIKANLGNLFINVKDSFEGMTDMCEPKDKGWESVAATTDHIEYTKGIRGAWFVGDSRDYFTYYCDGGYEGIKVNNCCGRFILAIKTN